jgi:hypothetical protein
MKIDWFIIKIQLPSNHNTVMTYHEKIMVIAEIT